MLSEMGYEMTDTPDEADFILFNTCAVREHAEDRAFGNVGALRHLKKERPGIVIAMCGCMAQQEKNVEKIKKSYPQVNLLFGTHALWRFPSLLYRVLTEKKRVFDIGGEDDIAEGLPGAACQGRKGVAVHHVRLQQFLHLLHRAVSCAAESVAADRRRSEKELRELVAAGYKEITLLGQNVNSYGKDLGIDVNFADLLRRSQRRARRFLAAVYDEPPEGRVSQAVFHHGGVRQGRKAAPSAVPVGQRRDSAPHEPPLYGRALQIADCGCTVENAGYYAVKRYYRRFPGRNGRGFRADPEAGAGYPV